MGSYLNIYLQRKKKDGEEQGERLLLCSISRANEIYGLFYDNQVGKVVDNGRLHEFTCEDIESLTIDIDEAIARVTARVYEMKENLSCISNKDAIHEILDDISADKECIRELLDEKSAVNTLYTLFSDVGKDYCTFDKLYWYIE